MVDPARTFKCTPFVLEGETILGKIYFTHQIIMHEKIKTNAH